MSNDYLIYIVCDYSATGEGRTVMTLVTYAMPSLDDYEQPPSQENNYRGVLKLSRDEIALKQFKNHFGAYYAIGAEKVSREEFFKKYSSFVPPFLERITDTNDQDPPFNIYWHGSFHYNYS